MGRRSKQNWEADDHGKEPEAGDIWWCSGRDLKLDGDEKVRPVLVVSLGGRDAIVVPMTTKKPDRNPISVAHRGGLSWLTDKIVDIPVSSLISFLGSWNGFYAWRTSGR